MNTQFINSATTLSAPSIEADRATIKSTETMSTINFKAFSFTILLLTVIGFQMTAQINCTSPGVFETKPCLYVTDQVTNAEYCTGETYTWSVNNTVYTTAGQYTVAQTDGNGCAYQSILNLTENTSCFCCIGDLVWLDANSNGVQDATEVGIVGVTVLLKDITGAIVESQATDASGHYLFDGITCELDYIVEIDTTTLPQLVQYGGVYVSQFLVDYFGGGNCTDGSAWGSTENGEYIELTGVPGTSVGCWVISDGDGAITLPPTAVIPADGVLVLCGGCDSLPNCDYDDTAYVKSSSTNMGFANSNDMIVVMDPTGAVVFSLEFGSNTDNTIPAINSTFSGACAGFATQTITPSLSLGTLAANQAFVLQANGTYVGAGSGNDGFDDLGVPNGPGVPEGTWTKTYDFDGVLDHQSTTAPPIPGLPDPNCDLRHDFGYTDLGDDPPSK